MSAGSSLVADSFLVAGSLLVVAGSYLVADIPLGRMVAGSPFAEKAAGSSLATVE